jgi:hypothetical protein
VTLSTIQRFLWDAQRTDLAGRGQVRALRLSGVIDDDRLHAAVIEVAEAMEILRVRVATGGGDGPVMVAGPAVAAVSRARLDGGDGVCVDILRNDRDRPVDPSREALARFHLIRCAQDEVVLALVADPLVLDLRSIYLVLGATMQAYLGRFRVAEYPTFANLAAVEPVGQAAARSRRAWWADRIRRWTAGSGGDARPAGHRRSAELPLAADRWEELTRVTDNTGNTGSIAVIALLAWWFRTRTPERPAVFASTLDLRDYLGLGTVVGPLTDSLAFEVDLDGYSAMTFRDLVRRTHVGVLDGVVHYLPYADLVALAAAQGVDAPPWDVAVHYCRLPPTSSYTRGEQTLAERGLSIELFRESELARATSGIPADPRAATMDVYVAEAGTGMALVVNFDDGRAPADVRALLGDIHAAVGAVTADPDIPLCHL